MMPDHISVAVVIPNYNYARYLEKTVRSVLQQDPVFDEIIVVDDGSTDHSLNILKQFEGSIRVVTIANRGQLGAIQAGIEACVADYILTLDADDYALPGLVARIREAALSMPSKIQFQLSGVTDEGVRLSDFPTYPRNYTSAEMRHDNTTFGLYICPPTSGNVFSKTVLMGIDFNKIDLRGTIDGTPLFLMPYLGEVVSLNEPLVCYRVHAGSMSGGSETSVKIIKKEIRFFRKSWDEATQVIDNVGPIDPGATLFVKERLLLISAMENKSPPVGPLWRFLCILRLTRHSSAKKAMLAAWGAALLIPSVSVRRHLIKARRSSSNRFPLLRWTMKILTSRGHTRRA